MLVLKRKIGEELHIGPDIIVTIVEIRGDSVRVGIKAPDGVHIIRPEARIKHPKPPTGREAA